MTTLLRSGPEAIHSQQQGLSARQASWVLAGLYARRLANRVELGWRQQGSRLAASSKGSRFALWRNTCLITLGLLFASYQACLFIAEFAQRHGPRALLGVSVLLSSGATCNLLGQAFFSPKGASPAEEAAWLSTLPVPQWVPFTCQLCERGLLNPYSWLLLFPPLTGLAAYGGWSWLAPLVGLGLCLPLFLLVGMASGVGETLTIRFSEYRPFQVARFLGSITATLLVLGVMLMASLNALEELHLVAMASSAAEVKRAVGLVSQLRWLPFAGPARFLLARSSPAEALGWFGAFCAEVGTATALCAWALRRNYGADLWRSRSRSDTPRTRAPFLLRAPKAWDRLPSLAVLRKEWLWARRDPSWVARFASLVILGNGAALLLTSEVPTRFGRPAPVLIGLGAYFVLSFDASLERNRPGLRWLLSLSRPISWTLSRQAAIAGGVALVCALPAALVTWARLPISAVEVWGLSFGALSVIALAYLQAALWMRHVLPDSATSPLRLALNRLQVLVLAAALVTYTVWAGGRQSWHSDSIFGILVLAGFWRSSVSRLDHAVDPSANPERTLELKHGAAVIFASAMAPQMAIGFAAATVADNEGYLSPSQAFLTAQVARVLAGVLAIVWVQLRCFREVRATLGFVRGRGVAVILREGIAWAAVATLSAQLWLRVFPRSESSAGLVLAERPWLLVGLLCCIVPVFEELLFRGFVYRTLRKGWGWLPSGLLSAAVFAVVHPVDYLLPIFFVGLCAAAAFQRARSIAAPMLMHAMYNGVVIAVELSR